MATLGLDDVVLSVLLALFVLRRLVHAKRRRANLSPDEWIAVVTEKLRNPLRYRIAATFRWIVG